MTGRPRAVLFDRDDTLVDDVPYNGDPALVRPRPGAREALQTLRAAGLLTAVVTNQSGVARGLLTMEQVNQVNARIEHLLGPLGPWCICPHGPYDGCGCRKPEPGLILNAAAQLGVSPSDCVVLGDRPKDMEAALNAGARGILVSPAPPADHRSEVQTALYPQVHSLLEAVDMLLHWQ